jgi:hypothetical protein
MLGLGRHTNISELRYAYEQAMADTVRLGTSPAQALSAAYDALSPVRQRQVYGSPSTAFPTSAAPYSAGRARNGGTGSARLDIAKGARTGRIRKRAGPYLVVAAVAIVVGAAITAEHRQYRRDQTDHLRQHGSLRNRRMVASGPCSMF